MSQQRRKTRTGLVVSDKGDKTVIVAMEWRQRHPLYRKSVRRITRFHAHDEQNNCRVGDQVRIVETRPISKTKRWRVVEVLARGEVLDVKPIEIGAALENVIQATPSQVVVQATAEEATPPAHAVAEAMVEPGQEAQEEVAG